VLGLKICGEKKWRRVAISSTSLSRRSSVNFINNLRTAFTLLDPKSGKKIYNLTVFFMLLGSVRVKAVRKTLVRLTPKGYSSTTKQTNREQCFETLLLWNTD